MKKENKIMRGVKEIKNTEIGRIPKEWKVVRLEDVFTIHAGGDISKLRFSKQKNRNYKFPIYSNSLENNGLYGYANTYQYPENSITVTGRGTLGYAIPRFEKFNAIIRLLVLIPKIEVDIIFISEYINSRINFKLEKTSIPQLTAPKLAKYKLPLPPLPEQQKIAEILSTVDEAIEKVDESIKKTKRLKKGLMQGLLTKGIGHKEFKDTEIGNIPKEWEVVRLEEVADINKESRDPNREFSEREFLYIDIDSIENGTGVIKSAKIIKGREAPSRARRVIHFNDVIMSTVRPYLKAFAIVPREYNAQICSTGFAVLTCKEKILPSYLLYILFSNCVISQCNRMMVGGQYPALNNSQTKKIKIPLPSIPEQQKIAEILSTVDKRLELLRLKKEKLTRIKKGLMNDLLTGKRRVILPDSANQIGR